MFMPFGACALLRTARSAGTCRCSLSASTDKTSCQRIMSRIWEENQKMNRYGIYHDTCNEAGVHNCYSQMSQSRYKSQKFPTKLQLWFYCTRQKSRGLKLHPVERRIKSDYKIFTCIISWDNFLSCARPLSRDSLFVSRNSESSEWEISKLSKTTSFTKLSFILNRTS